MGTTEAKREMTLEERMFLYSELAPALERFSVADICFVCDITGSMHPHMTKVKDALMELVDSVSLTMSYKPRLAFIGFRDRDHKEQLVVKDFTKDVNEIKAFISKIECSGEGDECEDVVAPLVKVLDLDWRSDVKQVYLIVDAPTHGKAYLPDTKYEITDNYPKEDEKKMLEKLCCHFRRNKVSLTVIQCRKTVKHMVEMMKVLYKSKVSELNTIDLCRSTGSTIMMSVRERLGTSLAKDFISATFKDFKMSTQIFNRPAGISCPEPEHMMMQPFKALKYTCHIENEPSYESGIYDYSFMMDQAQSRECSFEVSSDVLGTGKFSDCRYLKAHGDDTIYVAKIPKEAIRALAAIKPAGECYIVTRLFATAFCGKLNMSKLISVPSILILGLQNEDDISVFNNSTFLLAQEYITGEYVKYNNNCGWAMDGDGKACQLAQAFSHFTYEYSNGTLIIVDIQGVWNEGTQRFLLTDPAIHSIYRKKSYGITDMSKRGVLRFFKTHKCNDFCKKLNLLEVTLDRLKVVDDGLKRKYEEFKKSSKFKHVCDETMESVFEKWKMKFKDFNPEKEPALATPEEEGEYSLSASASSIGSLNSTRSQLNVST